MNQVIVAALLAEGLKAPNETAAREMASAFDVPGNVSDAPAFARECRKLKPHLFGPKSALAMSMDEFNEGLRAIRDAEWRHYRNRAIDASVRKILAS